MKVDPKLCPSLIYYIERHIEIDGDEHSYLAEKCLKVLCGDDPVKWRNSYLAGMKSLEKRRLLWDSAYLEIRMALFFNPLHWPNFISQEVLTKLISK